MLFGSAATLVLRKLVFTKLGAWRKEEPGKL